MLTLTSLPFNKPYWLTLLQNFNANLDQWGISWELFFPFAIWHLWLNRNNNSFNNKYTNLSFTAVLDRCKEFNYCVNSPNYISSNTTIHIKWLPPTQPSLKLNIDGAFKGKYKTGGIGGVFRNDKGDWILGYLDSALAYTPAYIELLALKTGLQLAVAKNFFNLEIETDATDVISLLHNDTCSIYSNLVTECRSTTEEVAESADPA